MLDALASGLLDVLQPSTFLMMLIGMSIGFLVGLLPGLGGAVTLAIMLPFAFGMSPSEGIAFLLGIWFVTAIGGDITSVLFGVPGEPTSAAAVMDGYPLTRQGQSGRALGAVLMSSALGAIFGVVALALTITIIRPVVLLLGPPEFFALTILGLTFIVTLAGKHLLKGFIMASLGVLLALVGVDSQIGIERYTFGQMELWNGVNLVPVVIGLFGGAEVLQLMLSKRSISQGLPSSEERTNGRAQGIRDAFKHWGVVIRSSAIGVVVGMLPGLGGSVSQWMAYGNARQTSKNPEKFGKGAIDGLVAAGATSNAKDGGQLVPTIAFGIPGGASTAVLLGGFMILGLTPGKEMLTSQLDLTMSMVWIGLIVNIIVTFVALLFVKPLSRLTNIPGPVLVPTLLILLVIGSYSVENSLFGVLIMVISSAIGVLCLRFDWPRIPFLLAMVLGSFAESYFNLSMSMFGAEWFTRPGVILLFAVTLFALLVSIRQNARGTRSLSKTGKNKIKVMQ